MFVLKGKEKVKDRTEHWKCNNREPCLIKRYMLVVSVCLLPLTGTLSIRRFFPSFLLSFLRFGIPSSKVTIFCHLLESKSIFSVRVKIAETMMWGTMLKWEWEEFPLVFPKTFNLSKRQTQVGQLTNNLKDKRHANLLVMELYKL